MLIFSLSAEEYKFDLIIAPARFLNIAMLFFLGVCRLKSKFFLLSKSVRYVGAD